MHESMDPLSSGWLNPRQYLIRMSYGGEIMSSGCHTVPFFKSPGWANFDFHLRRWPFSAAIVDNIGVLLIARSHGINKIAKFDLNWMFPGCQGSRGSPTMKFPDPFSDKVPIFTDFLQHENTIFWPSPEFTRVTQMQKKRNIAATIWQKNKYGLSFICCTN